MSKIRELGKEELELIIETKYRNAREFSWEKDRCIFEYDSERDLNSKAASFDRTKEMTHMYMDVKRELEDAYYNINFLTTQNRAMAEHIARNIDV
jgi:hypothetical protein